MDNRIWGVKKTTRSVGDREVDFHPLPVGMLLRLRNTCKEAAPFLAMCLTDTSKDAETETISSVTETKDGTYPVTNTNIKAVSPSTATFRFQQKERSIESLIDTLFSDSTRDLLADILIASAPGQFEEADKETLLDNIPAPVFVELFRGIFEVNKGAFAGLGEHLPRLFKKNGVVADGAEKIKETLTSLVPEQ